MRTSCSFSERLPCIVCNDSSPELARCACLFRSSASPSDADVEGGQAGLGDDSHGALPVPLISTPGEPIGIITLEDVMEELIQVRAEDTELLTPACGCNTVSGSPRRPCFLTPYLLPYPCCFSSRLLMKLTRYVMTFGEMKHLVVLLFCLICLSIENFFTGSAAFLLPIRIPVC